MNILIDQAGVCRICDFGLSTLVHQQELGDLTKTTVRDGPERYLAPEIFASVDSHPAILTSEGDIYSLGCIILEVGVGPSKLGYSQTIVQFIEGVYPFQRLATNHQVIDAILGRLPPASRCESNHNLPTMTDTLWTLLDACWGEPSSRPNVATVVKCVASLANAEGAQCLTALACIGSRCSSTHYWTAPTCDMKGATTKDSLPRSIGAHGQAGGNHGKWRRWKWSGRKKGKSMARNHI
jgi:serine/threonine protein kinase